MAEMMKFAPMVGSALQVAGAVSGGLNAKAAADSQAAQLDAAANTAQASSQRAASEQRRKARLGVSRALAVAGGGAGDIGVQNLMADIAGEGEYRALAALFDGSDRAAGLRDQANVKRWEVKQARTAGYIGGISSALSSGGSAMFEKYGKTKSFGKQLDPFFSGTRGSGD